MTIEILADRIKQLVNLTQELLLYSIKLREMHDKYLPTSPAKSNKYKTSEIPTIIRFLHCSFYYDALLNINTLLNPVQSDFNKKEQSIFELIDLEEDRIIKVELLKEANEFVKKLADKNLNKWRHKLAGHKDIENAGDTEIMYLNFIKKDIIQHSIALIDDINLFIINKYDVHYNNTFASLYSKSFDKMIELFEKDLKKQNKLKCSF
jgi:hypothetical protein